MTRPTRRAARRVALGGPAIAAWLLACPAPRDARVGTPVRPTAPAEARADAPAVDEATAPPAPRDPPRVLTDPGSGVRIVWSGAAARATVAGRSLVVLEPDLRHLDAVDWGDGRARWRIEQPASEGVLLYGLGDHVLLHDRDRALVIEAARGRVLGQHPAPWTGPWPYVHEVHQTRGACAWLGPCGIQPFDCQDGRPLGEYRPSPEIHLYGLSDDPSEHDTSCSPSPRLLGRHEDVIVLTAAAASEAPVLVGLAADTGQPRWQQPLPADLAPAGLTDDGGCWVLDESTPRVDVLDCRDGTLRWQQGIGPGALEVQAVGDVLVVAREHGGRWRLSAYATADGRPGWSARLARRQHPVLPGGPVRDAQLTGTRRVYALVDPARAGVVGELVAGRDERLWPDPSGGFLLIGRELRELDAEGRLTRQRPFTGTRVHTVTAGHVLTHDGQTIEIYDRDQLRERARIEGRLSIQAEDRLPADRLLLRRHGDDGVALVLGLEAPSRSGTYR